MQQIADYMAANSAGNAIVLTGDFNMGSSDQIMLDFAINNGFNFVCEEVGVSCGIDMVLYKGTDQFTLSAASQVKLDDENISDHDPRKAVIQWEKNPQSISISNVEENWANTTGYSGGSTDEFVITNLSSYSGGDPSVVRMRTSNGQCQVVIQEDQSNDDEVGHVTETVDIFVIGSQALVICS